MQNILLVIKQADEARQFLKQHAELNKVAQSAVLEFNQGETALTAEECRSLLELTARQFSEPSLFVIYEFQTLSEVIQNTLLKALEEHQENIGFLLVTKNLTMVLSTVRSRCKIVYLHGKKPELSNDDKTFMDELMAKLQKNPQLLVSQEIKLGIKEKKEKALAFLDNFILYGQEKLVKGDTLKGVTLARYLKQAILNRQLIAQNNVEPEIAIDHVFLG